MAQASFLESADYGYQIAGCPDKLGVWWCEPGWKVGRSRPLPTETSTAVTLSAARGEYEPVQVVLRPKQDTWLIGVQMTDLRAGKHTLKRQPINVREVAYVRVTHPTDAMGAPGNYPDPLPPLKMPLALKAGQNQPLWITVYVPYGTPAGQYKGSIRLQTDQGNAQVPLKLTVYDFDLPRQPHLRSGFGIDPGTIERYHKPQTEEQKRQLWDRYMRNFKEHRLCPYNFYAYDNYEVHFEGEGANKEVVVDFSRFDRAAKRYLDEFGFNSFVLPLPGMGGGRHPNFSKGEFGGFQQGTPEYEWLWNDYLRQVESHLKAKGWLKKAYTYWYDEPEPADYDFVIAGQEQIKSAAPGIPRMLTEQPEPKLTGHVDLWCALTPTLNRELVMQRRKAGEEIWWYVCTGPKAPYATLFIDHPGTEMRLWLWQTWQLGVQGILVWATVWWHNPFAYPESLQNPWEDPMSYVWDPNFKPGTRAFWGNGDGRFFYPPRRDPNKAQEPAIEDPIPSFRWECLRDGVEDYDYFYLLDQLVQKAEKGGKPKKLIEEARKLLQVPPDISKSLTEFTFDPRPMLRHREKVAHMIEKLRNHR